MGFVRLNPLWYKDVKGFTFPKVPKTKSEHPIDYKIIKKAITMISRGL